jgi:hypothetical protein
MMTMRAMIPMMIIAMLVMMMSNGNDDDDDDGDDGKIRIMMTTDNDKRQCCGGDVVTDTAVCCGMIVDVMIVTDQLYGSYRRQCCGGDVVTDTAVCCGNATSGQVYLPQDNYACCGMVYSDAATSLCCVADTGHTQVRVKGYIYLHMCRYIDILKKSLWILSDYVFWLTIFWRWNFRQVSVFRCPCLCWSQLL